MRRLHSAYISKSVRQHDAGLISDSDLFVLCHIQILGYICVCGYCSLTVKPTSKGNLWMSCRTLQDGQCDNIDIIGSTARVCLSDPGSQIASGADCPPLLGLIRRSLCSMPPPGKPDLSQYSYSAISSLVLTAGKLHFHLKPRRRADRISCRPLCASAT